MTSADNKKESPNFLEPSRKKVAMTDSPTNVCSTIGSPANYRGGVKSLHFGSLLYSTVHLNLNCSLVFLVKSFFSVLSSPERTKVPGTRALESLAPLLTLLQGNIPRSSLACRYKPFCRVQGAAERCCQRAQRKLACWLHSECSTFKPKATHCVRQF